MCIVVAIGARAAAETDKEKAAALWREGKQLLAEGKLEKACKKFEASERLNAAEGNRLNLADCWEKTGKTASAWEMFVKLAGSAKREDRAVEARRRAKELEPALVRLTIQVESELEDLVITRNDQVVDRALWNKPVPVDPDEYTITAKADGREEWSKTIDVTTKDKTVEVPELDKRAAPVPSSPPARPTPKLALGFVAGGGVAIALGAVFGVRSRILENQSDELCPNPRCADQQGVELNGRARREGRIANLGLGLGGAAVVTGLVLWKLARTPDRVSITVDHAQAGLAFGGTF